MHDLNLNLFYKTSFEIDTVKKNDNALRRLVRSIRYWMTEKWSRKSNLIPTDDGFWSDFKSHVQEVFTDAAGRCVEFKSASFFDKEVNNWACTITEIIRLDGYVPRNWITEIGFTWKERNRGTVSIILSYGDAPGRYGLLQEEPQASIPKIVVTLKNNKQLNCCISGEKLTLEAKDLCEQDFPWFWKLISNPERQTPVIFISPRAKGNPSNPFVVDPEKIERALGPSAFVLYSTSGSFISRMKELPNYDYRCTNGAVRIYASKPDVKAPGDQARHRFFKPDAIEKMGVEAFVTMLRRVLAQDVCFYESMVRTSRIVEKVRSSDRRKAILEDLKKERERADVAEIEAAELKGANSIAARAEQKAQEAMDMFELASKELSQVEGERDNLEEERRRLIQENHGVQAKMAYYKDSLSKNSSRKVLDLHLNQWPMEKSDIVELFKCVYGDKFDFSDNVSMTIDECGTSPEYLWNALLDLMNVGYGLLATEECGDIAKKFKDRSSHFEWARNAGTRTRKDSKLRREYIDTYQGRELNFETHIKSGNKESGKNFIRIYFAFDKASQKIIISSIGKHLDNYTTQFLN